MAAAALDTLRIAKRLKDAGFSESQAEAMTGVLSDTRDADLAQLASKADLALLRSQIETMIVSAKNDVIRWLFGVALGLGATVLAVLKLFPGHP